MRPIRNHERRRFPRFSVDLPLDYQSDDLSKPHGALVLNLSEAGLQLFSLQDLPVGTVLKITVLFPKEFRLSNFKVSAEIVWKSYFNDIDFNGYRYGLRFIELLKEDQWELQELLYSHLSLENFGKIKLIERP